MNDTENQAPSAIRGYLGAWRRQWWIVLGVTILAILVAALWSSQQQPVYAAQMKIVVGQGEGIGGSPLPIGAQSLTQTMTDLIESDVVANKAAEGLPISGEEVLSHLTVSTKPEASVLTVTYEDTDVQHARLVLEQVGKAFTQLVDNRLGKSSQGATREGEQVVSAKVFDPAHELPEKVSPKTKRNLVIAGILGLLAGLFLALVRDSLSRRVRSLADAEQAFGVQVAGLLPPGAIGKRPRKLAQPGDRPMAPGEDFENVFEIVAANIRFTIPHPDSGAFLVTSAMAQEGKTQIVANIARTMARSGLKVVAVEGDVRRPALHRAFQLPPQQPGLTDVVRGESKLSDVLVPISERDSQLLVLPAGSHLADTHDIFTVGRSAALMEEIRGVADYAIFDSAPLLLVPDAYPIAQLVDRVLVVAREGTTKRDEAEAVRDKLGSLGVSDYSVILTDSSAALKRSYTYRATPLA